jgi:Zn-dependent protease
MDLLHPEPTRWDINFRLFGTPVRVDPGFWIVHGLIALLFAVLFGSLYFFIWFGGVFVSILIHEFGHVGAGRCFGARGEIVLTVFGGLAVGSNDLFHRWQRIVVICAGPLAQLVFAGLLWLAYDWVWQEQLRAFRAADPQEAIFLLEGDNFFVVLFPLLLLIWINICWPLFNLLPIPPLDGGQIAREVVDWMGARKAAPWEQDPDAWKRGAGISGWSGRPFEAPRRPGWVLLLGAVAVAGFLIGWEVWRSNRGRLAREAKGPRREAYRELARFGFFNTVHADRNVALYFDGSPIGDQQLKYVAVFDELEILHLNATRVTDAGLRHLQGLPALQWLYLKNTAVTDAGLSQLRKLVQLRSLHLGGTKVTDAGLKQLRSLRRLEWLSLSHTRVTDAGLEEIKNLPRLKYIHLSGTKVSPQAIARLKKAMPSLAINPVGPLGD